MPLLAHPSALPDQMLVDGKLAKGRVSLRSKITITKRRKSTIQIRSRMSRQRRPLSPALSRAPIHVPNSKSYSSFSFILLLSAAQVMHHAPLLAPRPCTQGRGVGVRGSVNLQESKTLTPDPSPLSTRERGVIRLAALVAQRSIGMGRWSIHQSKFDRTLRVVAHVKGKVNSLRV